MQERPPSDAPGRKPAVDRLVSVLRVANEHPLGPVKLVALVTALVAIAGSGFFLFGKLNAAAHPHEQVYRRLADLDLNVTHSFVESRFGKPRSTAPLCAKLLSCSPPVRRQDAHVSLYESDNVVVEAVYLGDSLQWFAYTPTSNDLKPSMTWLGYQLGELGKTSYHDALATPDVQPSDTHMFTGPRALAYVEVFAGGAPAHYDGLLLATSPTGPANTFATARVRDMERLNDKPFDAHRSKLFRSTSTPNTFGRFVDDGPLTAIFESAATNRVLLLAFSEP